MPDTTRHPAIEAFLTDVGARLRRLPEARRAAEREELAQHLDLLVTAYRARGMDADAAARAAIERFGRAERIGADLAKAGRKTAEYARFFAWYAAFIPRVRYAVISRSRCCASSSRSAARRSSGSRRRRASTSLRNASIAG